MCLIDFCVSAFQHTFDKAQIPWNVHIRSPSLMQCGITSLAKLASQVRIVVIVLSIPSKSCSSVSKVMPPPLSPMTFGIPPMFLHDDRCSPRKRFKDDDAEHLMTAKARWLRWPDHTASGTIISGLMTQKRDV